MEHFIYKTSKIILGSYARLFLDFDLQMLAELPAGPKLFTCNHPTSTDPFYLGLAINEPVYMLATSDVFENPITRYLLQKAGHIPVLRNKGKGLEIVNSAVEYLRAGKNVAIFPEGSLSPEIPEGFGVGEPHSGAARIALASGARVVPVGVCPDKGYLSRRMYHFSSGSVEGRLALRGPYSITVGRAMEFEGDPWYRPQVKRVGQQIINEIRHLAEMSQERMNTQRVYWNSLLKLKPVYSSHLD